VSLVFLSLGSNQGDRRATLELAVQELSKLSRLPLRTSCIYETQAVLSENANLDWNLPYLNMAVEIDYQGQALQLLSEIQNIEIRHGRVRENYWAPRTLDIDILFWEQLKFDLPQLKIPHASWSKRAFVLDPLKDLAPSFAPDFYSQNILQMAHSKKQHMPSIMGILNVTPDSFSDGGAHFELSQIESYLSAIENEIAYLDIGAESTRPQAKLLTQKEEWDRLHPVLEFIKKRYQGQYCRPKISVDTYHGETAAQALAYGVDVINDVGGFRCPVMKEVLSKSGFKGQYVLMHSVCVPADPKRNVESRVKINMFLKDWFSTQLRELENLGVHRDRVILDPGLGFGKNQKQSFEILRGFDEFWNLGCQVLMGHSRKSFLAHVSSQVPAERDFESIGISVGLAQSGIDILRVHNPKAHKRVINGLHIYQENFQKHTN
jgi:2-amino-4-hydroxy-6-hydroxymethyldihydropteridine diphosphokinase/dihydropteroate synthase